jgi:hypothetical protein
LIDVDLSYSVLIAERNTIHRLDEIDSNLELSDDTLHRQLNKVRDDLEPLVRMYRNESLQWNDESQSSSEAGSETGSEDDIGDDEFIRIHEWIPEVAEDDIANFGNGQGQGSHIFDGGVEYDIIQRLRVTAADKLESANFSFAENILTPDIKGFGRTVRDGV